MYADLQSSAFGLARLAALGLVLIFSAALFITNISGTIRQIKRSSKNPLQIVRLFLEEFVEKIAPLLHSPPEDVKAIIFRVDIRDHKLESLCHYNISPTQEPQFQFNPASGAFTKSMEFFMLENKHYRDQIFKLLLCVEPSADWEEVQVVLMTCPH